MPTFDLGEIESISREAEVIEGSRMKSRGVSWVGRRCLYDRHSRMLIIFFSDFQRLVRKQWLLYGVHKILRKRSLDQSWRTEKFFKDCSRCVVDGIDTPGLARAIATEIEAL